MLKLNQTILKAFNVNKDIRFEVFIHKVDGLSDDTKIETQRDIHQRTSDDLVEAGLEDQVKLSFYLTSIYDHSKSNNGCPFSMKQKRFVKNMDTALFRESRKRILN